MFLDIESTGLSTYYDQVTLVGWSVGNRYEVVVEPSEIKCIDPDVCARPIVITFNGTMFDLPFLTSRFNTDWSHITHVDLRYLAKRVGLTGGQKKIEITIGLAREGSLENISGAEAVELWFDYKEGDLNALQKLIRYNHADIEGMKFLFEEILVRLEPGIGAKVANGGMFERSTVCFSDRPRQDNSSSVQISPYCGRKGPRLRFSKLHDSAAPLNHTTVVGIDLTGSEARKSGWAAVTGRELTTSLIASDDDLVAMTLAAKPFLVSIDSPLSLPSGRLSEFDDDPGREKYGIVRQAERQLRKRGINVYPALLPSMQRLTRRGVELAMCLRRKGVPVIESYPGAAQDILGIPRKQTSLKHLAEGLRRFGYDSLLRESTVSHDELDAATSALVGQFMLAGYWEALGSADEDYLIVPTTNRRADELLPELVVGLSGPIAAGKTTAAKFLEQLGFRYCRFSEILAKEFASRGIAVTRDMLQKLGDETFNSRFGQRRLQNKLAASVEGAQRIVVDGLRHLDDLAFLREKWGFAAVHVHISANTDLRECRYTARSFQEGLTFQTASSHSVERHVPELKKLADYSIVNEGLVESLESRLTALVKRRSMCPSP
ncbi:MAG: DUF429 domain-containing protein [Gammaproteobacteria bacterium]|nr:DUF429 domain-containing protein [Gammaproteobacteria bacterium]